MSGGGKVPQPQVIRMPNPNDPTILAAAKRAVAKASDRTGRDSTVLSQMSQANINGSQGMVGR